MRAVSTVENVRDGMAEDKGEGGTAPFRVDKCLSFFSTTHPIDFTLDKC